MHIGQASIKRQSNFNPGQPQTLATGLFMFNSSGSLLMSVVVIMIMMKDYVALEESKRALFQKDSLFCRFLSLSHFVCLPSAAHWSTGGIGRGSSRCIRLHSPPRRLCHYEPPLLSTAKRSLQEIGAATMHSHLSGCVLPAARAACFECVFPEGT